MSPPPRDPKIYHITHVDNLPGILRQGGLWSDSERIARSLDCQVVGMHSIKKRRLEVAVTCRPGTKLGEYVPFYLCPRSVMLYILYQGNHEELHYRGGQRPIVHLEADLKCAAAWADAEGIPWAFTDMNAAASYTSFFGNLRDLEEIDWSAVAATDWRASTVKERKQAEFLVFRRFPWKLVQRIGVRDPETQAQVQEILNSANHRPTVEVLPSWYY